MIIDTITLIIGLSITLTTILALLFTPFWRKTKVLPAAHSTPPLPEVSILIPTHDNAPELKRNLPIFLQQEYAGEYRVIVVADKGDHDTEDLIKQLQSTYKNLYATYLPDSSRYMSRTKLAITLGVKAAHTEWITITDPTCKPQDEHWLASWAENMNDDSDFIMGYVAMDETCPAIWRFEHALLANQCLSSAQRGKAWATNCPNIALRKSRFMKEEGFRGNLQLVRGEYDFLVNKYARHQRTHVDTRTSSWLYEEAPSKKTWNNRKMYFRASRPQLKGYKSHRLYALLSNFTLHAGVLTTLASAIYAGLCHNWILLGVSVFYLLLIIIVHTLLCHKTIVFFDAHLSKTKMFFYEMRMAWRSFRYKVNFMRADKNDFTSHKL